MNDFEERLRRELTGVEDATPAPAIDVPAVALLGRRERTRRWGVASGAVAVLVVAAVGVSTALVSGSPDAAPRPGPAEEPSASSPSPPSPSSSSGALPVGGGTQVPWWSDGVLHVGTATYPVPGKPRIEYRSGTTVLSTFHDGEYTYEVVRGDGPLRPLPVVRRDPASLVISPDGNHLAWIETVARSTAPEDAYLVPSAHEQLLVVDYDLDADRVVATLDQTADVVCCDAGGLPQLQGITDAGLVVLYAIDAAPPRLWDPATGAVTTVEVDDGVLGADLGGVPAWPSGVAYQDSDSSDGRAALVSVDGSGHLTSTEHVPQATYGTWNDDGTHYAYDLYPDAVLVATLDGAAPAPLPLPEPASAWSIVAWESSTDLLVVHDGRDHQVARCDVVALACESVADVPTTGRLDTPGVDY